MNIYLKTGKKIAAAVAAALLFLLRPLDDYHQRALCCYAVPGELEDLDLDTVLRETKGISDSVKKFMEKQEQTIADLKVRQTDIEQRLARRPSGNVGYPDATQALSDLVEKSPQFDLYLKGHVKECRIPIPGGLKTAIVNQPPAVGQVLVAEQRVPGIIEPARRRLYIRDLIPTIPTTSNLIFYPQEDVFTNNAAIVFSSPNDRENVSKPESGITFKNAQAVVETIAHTIPLSKQVLQDVPQLRGYVDGRLLFGLKLAEEVELLTGDGSSGHLSGLITNAIQYNRSVSNDSVPDTIRKAVLQVALSNYQATGVVLNPIDFANMELLKDTQGRYLMLAVMIGGRPQVWRIDVVESNSMTQGSFLVGNFDQAAAIFDREDAAVELGYVNDQFTKNMVTLRCEERLGLAIYRPSALVRGVLPPSGT